ncbi:non-specific DNA-binding protein DpsA [soil metagenome]
MQLNIGIDQNTRKDISQGLAQVLADTYTLYLQTHNFHWNVTGPMFETLHLLFEKQYNELWLAADFIAERIRSLGFPAPGTYAEFTQLATIKEQAGVPDAKNMLRILLEGHESLCRSTRNLFPLAEDARDASTADLLTERMEAHEKTSWMLRSLLEV